MDILKLISIDCKIFPSIHRTVESCPGEPMGPCPALPPWRLPGVRFSRLQILPLELSAQFSKTHGTREKRKNTGMSRRQGLGALTLF